MKLNNNDLINITGGASISAALISAVVKAFSTIIDLGKMIGSTIRRGVTKNYC